MAYDKQYYDDRKKDLNDDFESLKQKTFDKFITLAQDWQKDATLIQQKFQELIKKEEEAKPKEVVKEKK